MNGGLGPGRAAGRRWDRSQLPALVDSFERSPAEDVIEWAVRSFSPRITLAASMTDAVLIDLAVRVDPTIEVVFIDTGYHFQETLRFTNAVRHRYRLNLRVLTAPTPAEPLWRSDPEDCCSAVKV